MAAKKKSTKKVVKEMVGGKTATKVNYDGKKLTIVFGDPDNIVIDTPDYYLECDLDEIGVIPTKEDFEEAVEEIMNGD